MNRCAALIALAALSSPVFGQPDVVYERFEPQSRRVRSAEDYAAATPRPLPRVPSERLATARQGSPLAENPTTGPGDRRFESRPPTVTAEVRRALERVLFDPTTTEAAARRDAAPALVERTYGASGLDYTSSRLIPPFAASVFPYSAVGKLYYSEDGQDFVCSGAVIGPRLVITAAHCVHGGPGIGFYEDFEFVPAYRDGLAPYGSWFADGGFVTVGWVESPQVPSSQDFAILQLRDQLGVHLADATGQLNHVLLSTADNHLHLLGYPGNLDLGEQMHQVTSGDFVTFGDGTVVYGSDMSGGSSGGPWVQNFGSEAVGQQRGLNPRPKAVVGVTSYGFEDETIAAQGAAILNSDFRRLIRFVCDFQPGNC